MNRNIHRQLMEERGVDIRNPSSALFGVSSADRYENPAVRAFNGAKSPFKFTLNSNQNFMNGFFTRVALTEVKFTWAIQTITGNNNKLNLQYKIGAVPGTYTLTVPSGWYNPTSLASTLQGLIRSATGNVGFTLVADPITGVFTGATNNADTFNFAPQGLLTAQAYKIGLYQMMNWPPVLTPGSPIVLSSTISSGVPTMLRTQFIDIVCAQLTNNQDVKDGDTGSIVHDVLARIYLTPEVDTNNPELIGSQPFQIYRQFAFPKQIKWSPNQPITSGLQFEVYDDQGDLLTAGSLGEDSVQPDWNITLLVSEV